jgi:hypothetical protein
MDTPDNRAATAATAATGTGRPEVRRWAQVSVGGSPTTVDSVTLQTGPLVVFPGVF